MKLIMKFGVDTIGHYVSIEKSPNGLTLFSLDHMGFCTHWYYKDNPDFPNDIFILGVDNDYYQF